MGKVKFSEIVNLTELKKVTDNIYVTTGMPIGVIETDGTIDIASGWQEICTKFHRAHPLACKRCRESDRYIKDHLGDGKWIYYKCKNNMWDIAMPIVVSGEHIATIFLGQFFYDDEEIDIEYFRAQALEFGFNEEEYLIALSKVPRYSREKVDQILTYYKGFIMTLTESGIRQVELAKSQRELEKNEKYLSTILNSVNDAIFIHDVHMRIIDVNETASSMLGYSREELLTKNMMELVVKDPVYYKLNWSKLVNRARKNNLAIAELIARKKDGTKCWVEVNSRIVSIDEDKRIIVTVRDISERKTAQLALKNEALELEKLRTEFFANISHELRTPLNIILSSIRLNEMHLSHKEKPIDIEKVINSISVEKLNGLRLLRLINNLIDSTKFDAEQIELNMVNCNIISVVEEITLSVAKYIGSTELKVIFDTDIEEKIVACDLDKLERIILNLLSNSVKFTQAGGSIFVNVFDGEEYVTITVEDNGVGIPKEKLDVIFDRFRQVDKSFTRSSEGIGLGLFLVKNLVEIQGGSITVESKYGSGTKFSIKLPVKVVECNNSIPFDELVSDRISYYEEKIRVEFSDIYK
jgi:PAS domain S-box-containing protein